MNKHKILAKSCSFNNMHSNQYMLKRITNKYMTHKAK